MNNYQNEINVNYYLARFNEILFTLENQMMINETTNNIGIDFIRCIYPYHNSLTYICENILKYTKSPEINDIANNIVNTQKKQIEYIENIYNNLYINFNSEKDVNSYFKKYFKITNNMFTKVRNSKVTINLDMNFIEEMLPLFEGGIKICENALKYNINPKLIELINFIRMTQNNGYQILINLRQKFINQNSY